MVSHLFYYPLALLAILWLFVMLQWRQVPPRGSDTTANHAPPTPAPPLYCAQSVRGPDAQAPLCPV